MTPIEDIVGLENDRLDIGIMQTPLQPIVGNSADRFRHGLLLKRDDLFGVWTGSSKLRNLVYLFHFIKKKGYKAVHCEGAAFSNNLRLIALLSSFAGIKSILFISPDEQVSAFHENIKVMEAFGDSVPMGNYNKQEILQNFAEKNGLNSSQIWEIPRSSNHPVSVLGYFFGILELDKQLQRAGISKADFFTTTSSGTCLAGMLAASSLLETDLRINAVSTKRTKGELMENLHQIMGAFCQHYGVPDINLDKANYCIHDELSGNHGNIEPGFWDCSKDYFLATGSVLDPIFSGKTWQFLMQEKSVGLLRDGSAAVFHQTGGDPNFSSSFATRNKRLLQGDSRLI